MAVTGCHLSPEAKEAEYLQRGRKAFDQKDYPVAILQFKNAAAAMPADAEPHYRLGLVYLAEMDFESAAADLERATELNPKHSAAQLKLAGLLAGSPDKRLRGEAQEHANAVLELQPDDAEALDILATADLRSGMPASAQAHLMQALHKSPGHLKSWALLAQAKIAGNDVAGAEKVLLQASEQVPKSPDPKVYLGEFYRDHKRAPEAEQQFRKALAIDPGDGPALMDLGAMQMKAGQTDQAEFTYRRAAALPDRRYRPVHAEFLFQSGKRDEALAELEKLAAADPGDRELRTKLIETYLALHRSADAEKLLTTALKKDQFDQDALIRRSRIYLDSGKYTAAETDLTQLLRFRKSAEAHYLLAKISEARGIPSAQRRELREAVDVDASLLTARIDLARALLASRNAQAALTLLDEAPATQGADSNLLIERNWVLLALGKREEARAVLDRLLAAGSAPEALLQDADMKLEAKDYAGARASLNGILNKNPQDTRALFALFQSYKAQKQTAAGIQVIKDYALKAPMSAAVQMFAGEILAANGDSEGARRAFETVKAISPGTLDIDFDLAQLDANEGKLDEACDRLSRLVAAHPDNKNAHLFLARFEKSAGRRAAAIEQLRAAADLDSQDAMTLNSLASALAENKQTDEALKYAKWARQLDPDNTTLEDTLGWIYFQQGAYQLAVLHLEAAAAGGGSAVRNYRLAMAYLKAGKTERARATFEAAWKLNPNLPEAETARRLFNGPK